MKEGELDILITRVVDGRAAPEDWRRLEALADVDSGVWREVARAQRDDQVLKLAVGAWVGVAGSVEMGASMETLPEAAEVPERFRLGERTRMVAMWGGWAAAAAVALAFVTNRPAEQARVLTAGQPAVLSAADALSQYLAQGRKEGSVINEMPEKVLVHTQPGADGNGYEVVYLRMIMERESVPDLYRFTRDELGQRVPLKMTVPAAHPTVRSGNSPL